MNGRISSAEAYENVVVTGKAGTQRGEIYQFIAEQVDITCGELPVELDLPINVITPRVFELIELGLVEDHARRECKVSGRNVYPVKSVIGVGNGD